MLAWGIDNQMPEDDLQRLTEARPESTPEVIVEGKATTADGLRARDG